MGDGWREGMRIEDVHFERDISIDGEGLWRGMGATFQELRRRGDLIRVGGLQRGEY